MKYILTSLLTALLALSATAQIQIGSAEIPMPLTGGGNLDNNALEAFKKTTTVFYIQEADVARKAQFEQALKGVWTITPFIVAGPDEMDAYADGRKYSQAGFGGYIIQRTSYGGRGGTATYLTYDFGVADFDRSGKSDGRKLLARFLLNPDEQTLRQSFRPVAVWGKAKDRQEQSMMRTLYTTSKFANWGPGYLRGYAKSINDALLKKERRSLNTTSKVEGLSAVKRDTLFLPRSLQTRYSGLTGAERSTGGDDEGAEEMRSSYKFTSVWIDDEDLQQRILTATKPIYYLLYVRAASEKYVSVFNGKTGEMLYAAHSLLSYNFKGKDLKDLAKAID
jgi:hypothetical protein